jgi:N-hydroxyarylamine O-acetyltransferase
MRNTTEHSDLTRAHLRRLGVKAAPPSADALAELHRAYVETIPYETTWIHLGETWSLDETAAANRIAHGGRGGYCFHLNGAFARLLGDLGYTVSRHVGGVHRGEPDAAAMTNHLVLIVSELPTDNNPGGCWYVDAGLGDALYEPLPLIEGTYAQGPMTFTLTETPGGVGDWHFTHDPKGSFVGMAFRSTPAGMTEFAERHAFLSTSPESSFVRTVTVQRRSANTAAALRALQLRTITTSGTVDRLIDERAEWFALLADYFNLRLPDAPDAAKDALWRHANESHEAHLATTRATAETSSGEASTPTS